MPDLKRKCLANRGVGPACGGIWANSGLRDR